jgi:hypothetical protein
VPLFDFDGLCCLLVGGKTNSARVYLNGGTYTGYVRANGDFMIYNVPAGTYILDVKHVDYAFATVTNKNIKAQQKIIKLK